LDDIFSELKGGVIDKNEEQFISELHRESARLLESELDWLKKKKDYFSNFHNKQNLKNTISLLNHRFFLGQIDNDEIVKLQQLARKDIKKFKANALQGKTKREELSINSGSTIRSIVKILNRAFSRAGVLDAVSTYMGVKMRVSGAALELSVPSASWWKNGITGLNRAPNSLYAHLDESIEFPKSIMYLSDVKESNGPTSYYPTIYEEAYLNPLQEIIGRVVGIVGSADTSPLKKFYGKTYHQSMTSENFRRHFMRLPYELRFNSHFGWDVMPGSELETQLVSKEIKMLGSAGKFIVFDGAKLLHRGGLVEDGDRVALQIIFSSYNIKSTAKRVINKLKVLRK